METFFPLLIFVLFIIAAQAFSGSGKSKSKRKKSRSRQTQSPTRQIPGQTISQKSFARAATQTAIKTAQDFVEENKKDPNDKNKHRRADWGERAGPGILSAKNTISLIVIAVILYVVLSQLPADILR